MSELTVIPATLTIVIITVIVTIVAFRSQRIFELLMLHSGAIIHGNQSWRILTSALLHADWVHLAFNMFALYSFGGWIEHIIGGWRFTLIYILGIVVGSFASLIAHRNSHNYVAVGASGGVCAIIAAASILAPDLPVRFLFIPIDIPAWIAGCLFVAFSVFGSKRGFGNIGHEAHLGGTAAGITLIIAFFPIIIIKYWMYVAAMVATGAIIYAFVPENSSKTE